jgi:hypothetical protein
MQRKTANIGLSKFTGKKSPTGILTLNHETMRRLLSIAPGLLPASLQLSVQNRTLTGRGTDAHGFAVLGASAQTKNSETVVRVRLKSNRIKMKYYKGEVGKIFFGFDATYP